MELGAFYDEEYQFAKNIFANKKRILDVSCGYGQGTKILAEGKEMVVGVDSDPERTVYAAEHFGGVNITFECADGRKLPFPDNYFDGIASIQTIEHFVEQDDFFDELMRVSVPGAAIVVSTINHDAYIKMGMYKDAVKHEHHSHPGEMNFPQFYYLLNRHFDIRGFYGQHPITKRLTWKHRAANVAKNIDRFRVRRYLLNKKTLNKMNVSRELTDLDDRKIIKLGQETLHVLAVCANNKTA